VSGKVDSGAAAQGGLLRLSRDAERHAGHPHHRPLDLSGADDTVKTMYVAANHCDAVELFVNGKSLGKSTTPRNGYIFEFPQVKFEPGKISAVATANGKTVAQDAIETAGEAKAIKLTPHAGPNGLQADGSDVVFYDVEVVDAQRRTLPDRRRARGFQGHRPGHLARRLQMNP
jgi:beta-galactosidase